ncbi:helix-turn-helix domain-containing protein [Lactimicrobium massiliense]|uniref:helix-turn-helix domain-containing protein n=1 Tax=Lactimicrobium massiliense TaxID=2161814 RepID=UPI000D550C83|nr:helix-turn-helix transcriptional regulator [Lactimicrobium massiliense]
MNFNQKEIGQRVHELRIGRQLSLDQLADAVNCSRDHLYRAERGEPRHGFSIDILIEIAQYFDVSLDYLILGEAGNNQAIRQELMRISVELKMLCGKIR